MPDAIPRKLDPPAAACSVTVSPAWRSDQSIAKSDLFPAGRTWEVRPTLELLAFGNRYGAVAPALVVHRGLRRQDVSSPNPMNTSGIRPSSAKSTSVGGVR